ncbi:MAG: hypothetical protein AUF76_06555 [Acidobacteria bacterium 13_1_20CM_2_65_9]|nr:MAG: hypothetical protein AUF76_06555 [Acidobacteria bacterium 13_1_20CM_2_65_9]
MAASRRREYIWLTTVGAVLIAAIVLVRTHEDSIKTFIDQNPFLGVVLYIVLNILDAVLAPGATLPLIPVAAHAWGPVPAAIVTTIGWTAGSLIAFLIARRWGHPIVKKLTSVERLRRMKKYIPEDLFWSIVLLRLVLPMDVMSYVLGLFTDISWPRYVAATALGVAPSAFVLAYVGKLPNAYDFITFGVGAGVVIAYVIVARRRHRRRAAA